jgi:hypothetical protein
MNYQSPIQYVAQPTSSLEFRQHLKRRKILEFPGGIALWLAVSKVAAVVLAIVFGLQMWLGNTISLNAQVVQELEATRHGLKNSQIILLAERAGLMSTKHIQEVAGAELALFVPEEGQVYKFR